MRRNWNWMVWTGFALTLFSAFSYIPLFTRFPITRDVPWVNLLLFLAGLCLIGFGLRRAFTQPGTYRGKITGIVFGVLSLAMSCFFVYGIFIAARQIPSGQTALRVGQVAPEFSLAGLDGRPVALSQLRQGKRAVLLIFYRGYW